MIYFVNICKTFCRNTINTLGPINSLSFPPHFLSLGFFSSFSVSLFSSFVLPLCLPSLPFCLHFLYLPSLCSLPSLGCSPFSMQVHHTFSQIPVPSWVNVLHFRFILNFGLYYSDLLWMRSNFKREICLCFIYTLSIQSEGHFTPLLFVCQNVVHTGKVRSKVDFSTCDISFVGSKGNLISQILVNHKS